MSATSGSCTVTPGRVLGAERITNAKLNDLGNPIVRVDEGSITAREIAPGVLSATTPAPGSVTEASIVDDAVTNPKLAEMAAGTLKGRRSTTGNPEDLTAIQALDDILSVAEASVASATTTDIGAATSQLVQITGTTTITGLGTAAAGRLRRVRFAGILTLTHNGTSLILPGSANITTAAGDTAVFLSLGSGNWRCLDYSRANGLPVAFIDEDSMATDSAVLVPSQQSVKAYVDSRAASAYILIRDEKASGTAGGSFTSGAWRTRTLNTEVVDTGSHATLAANQITLAAGTYLCRAMAPAHDVGTHQCRVQDITNGVTLILGSNQNLSGVGTTNSMAMGRFVLAGSTVIELQHRCATTNGSGFGIATSWGTEIYAQVELQKVG